ncbi:hypothetical protein E5676_scaffold120G00850 [Cucumis melo var. makuwa]|uniref:Uncharacterized protein n=1 Tax=Cucumis melo var. makuwa TaxID=1194695 RepID=A0A5D3DZ91_CUCMM|nr:hypothetical protein E5676_scaffold120G00850 [Cucumis melo var. makuwa]
MRKGENFVWDETCQNAFDNIKKYLLSVTGVLPFAKDEARLPWLARTCQTPRTFWTYHDTPDHHRMSLHPHRSFWTCLEAHWLGAHRHRPSRLFACILALSRVFTGLLESSRVIPTVIESSRSIWALLGLGRT